MTSDRLSFASAEIDKSYSLTPPPWKNLCHRWSREQPRPGSFFQRPRQAEKREPGNEVGALGSLLLDWKLKKSAAKTKRGCPMKSSGAKLTRSGAI